MDYITLYRDPALAKKILQDIIHISSFLDKEIRLMEVCGTHTMAIRRFGINKALPENIKLISGPGCPVCVTPTVYIDKAVEISKDKDTIIATFGDMVKVPGSSLSLERAKANGAKIEVVYSPIDSIELAKKYKNKRVVFLAIGFETTVPSIGITLFEAKKNGLKNFFILEGNKLIPPVIGEILKDPETNIDGFILPGHVCTIIGYKVFEFIPKKYKIPCAVSGFESLDILLAIRSILEMICDKKPSVKNLYPRAVSEQGNLKAQKIIEEVFEKGDSLWRGMGIIKKSGLFLKREFKSFRLKDVNLEELFQTSFKKHLSQNPSDKHRKGVDVKSVKSYDDFCICGDILKGKALPYDCPLFGKKCTPEDPKGPCMISSEGTCAAYYKYA